MRPPFEVRINAELKSPRSMDTGMLLLLLASVLTTSCSGADDLDLGTIVFANVVSEFKSLFLFTFSLGVNAAIV